MTEDMIGTIIHPGKDKNNDDDQIFQELWDIVKRQEVRFHRIKEGLDKVQSYKTIHSRKLYNKIYHTPKGTSNNMRHLAFEKITF